MEVLPKVIIRTWILPHLTQSRNGRPSRVDPVELLEALLYKLKTGCQWRYLPVKQFWDLGSKSQENGHNLLLCN